MESNGWQRENAGAIRLTAFDQDWWVGPEKSGPQRVLESLPTVDNNVGPHPRANGQITHLHVADSQLIIGMNLDDIWSAPKLDSNGKALDYHAGVGGKPRRANLEDSGIKAMRQVAVDTSGTCGAPIVLVMVDQIRGSDQPPAWRYLLDAVTERYGRWEILDEKGKKVKRKLKDKYFKQGLPSGHKYDVQRYKDVSEQYHPPREQAAVAIEGNRFVIRQGKCPHVWRHCW